MDLTERTVESKTLFDGIIVTLKVDQAQLPDGKVATREVVEHPGGVAILALDEENNVTLVQQYRYPFHQVLLELPAGKLDARGGPPPRRHPGAERGDRPGGRRADLPGLPAGLSGFLHRAASHVPGPGPAQEGEPSDEDEFLNVITMPFQQLLEQVMDGTVEDAKTVATVLKTKVLLGL